MKKTPRARRYYFIKILDKRKCKNIQDEHSEQNLYNFVNEAGNVLALCKSDIKS